MNKEITGGCFSGAVRYEVSAPLGFQILCQCRNCQRFSGSAFSALAAAPRSGLVIHGEIAAYEYDNGNGTGKRRRVFCPKCGSVIHGGNPAEEIVTLSASSLDDPSVFSPREVIHHDDARAWHGVAARLIGDSNRT
jgi:hypothetical protein